MQRGPEWRPWQLRQAGIILIRKDRVKVEVCGAETTIISKELSWLALGVITDEFSINDQFYVRVSNIKEYRYDRLDGAACRLVTISASKRDAEPKPAEQYYDSFELVQITRKEDAKKRLSGNIVSM